MSEWKAYKHKVQYYETDQMGIVHHSNYIRWFEEARCDLMDQMGLGYEQMEAKGVMSPVLTVKAEYLRMVYFGDTVTIHTYIKEYNGIKMTIIYEVINDRTGMIHGKGVTKHCFIDKTGRPLAIRKVCPDYHEMFMEGLNVYKEYKKEKDEKEAGPKLIAQEAKESKKLKKE